MKRAIFLFLLATTVASSFAQKYTGTEAAAKANGCQTVWIHPARHFIQYLKPMDGKPIAEGEHLAWLAKSLSLVQPYSFVLKQKQVDPIGYTHYRYDITYRKVPIQNAVYYVHVKDGKVQSANGEYPMMKPAATTPAIKLEAAGMLAIKAFGTDNLQQDKQEKPLLTLVEEKSKLLLSYRFDLFSPTAHKREYIFVDALSGNVVRTRNRICTNNVQATAYTKYNGVQTIITDRIGSQYRLYETGRGGGVSTTNTGTEFYNPTTTWNDTTNQNNAACDIHFGLESTYDFYKNRYNRNGWDDQGAMMVGSFMQGQLYDNADWNGSLVEFGDGDGLDFNAFATLDVVGHECTHAVTQYSANLDYWDESGCLNESFSDIFGVAINFAVHPGTANYEMGTPISTHAIPFRDLQHPKVAFAPNTYLGEYWDPANEPHQNSTVQGHWFYLLANGGSGVNDNNDSYQVNGISLTKATDVAYRSLTVYLTPSSNYQDARDFSIQAAADLYGACSPEVVACTNAWYAVGVGSKFTQGTIADFSADKVFSCSIPAEINFTSHSTNASTYLWNFGDGQTSTQQNPTHTYANAGTYTVKLKATAGAACGGGTDSLTRPAYITVSAVSLIQPAACSPGTVDPTIGYGITELTLDNLYNASAGSSAGYEDFTCQSSVTLTEGVFSYLAVLTENIGEKIKAWIDLNNDGTFSSNELWIDSTDYSGSFNISILVPHPTVYNTLLRLRVASDYDDSSVLLTSCTPSYFGQYEDYAISIAPNYSAPIPQFTANQFSISVGDTVHFTDLSQNVPTSWRWYFQGGTPSSSTTKNPIIVYDTAGTYMVKLVVQNAYGIDSTTEINYITVINATKMCHNTGSALASGSLYDSGGSMWPYGQGEDCDFLLDIPCASSIVLGINYFYTNQGYDYLTVYDGDNASSPVLASLTGYINPTTFTSTTNKLYFTFHSDAFVPYPYDGFDASWQTGVQLGTQPIAGLLVSDSTPMVNSSVLFADNSTSLPTAWLWNFGDGSTSIDHAGFHKYQHPGGYTVTLTSSNCYGSSTITKVIIVKEATGIDNVDDNATMQLFPNPNNGQFQLALNNDIYGEYKLMVYAMDGKQVSINSFVKEAIVAITAVDLGNNLASGIYTATVTAPNGEQYHKKMMIR